MRNRGSEVGKKPHLMFVIVVLILSSSAIATPTSEPSSFQPKLQNEGVTKKE